MLASSTCESTRQARACSCGSWRERVLNRLARSLDKISSEAGDWKVGFALLRLAHDA